VSSLPGRQSAFGAAARRHYDDAVHLCEHSRHASADHLSGFAAECALKDLLVGFLGARVPERGGPPQDQAGTSYGHLPQLWSQVQVTAGGRVGAQFLSLLAGDNPFGDWDVSDRYADGSAITAQRAWQHIRAANRLLTVQQKARLRGAIS